MFILLAVSFCARADLFDDVLGGNPFRSAGRSSMFSNNRNNNQDVFKNFGGSFGDFGDDDMFKNFGSSIFGAPGKHKSANVNKTTTAIPVLRENRFYGKN